MLYRRLSHIGALMCVVGTGCSSQLAADNPYDPETPVDQQVPAQLDGTVTLEGASSYAGVEVVVTEARGDEPERYQTETLSDGAFTLELPSGTYDVEVRRAGYVGQTLANIELFPGEERTLAAFALVLARGGIQGTLSLDDGAAPTGTAVSLIPRDGRIITVLAGPDGSYFAGGLGAGEYGIRAEREGYAPAYTAPGSPARQDSDGPVTVVGDEIATAPDLVLYPAAAIVKVESGGTTVHYTQSREVEVVLYPFVQFLTDMRVSEDCAFADPAWDVDYRQFTTPVSFQLADSDGERTVCAQFRDSYELDTDTFSTTVMLDRELPEVLSFTINDGAPYLTIADGAGQAALTIVGRDRLAGIDAWRWTLAGAFGTEPFEPLDSVAAVTTQIETKALGDANGPRTVLVQLRDRAGNLSLPAAASIVRDRIAPLVGNPAIAIDPAQLDIDGRVSDLDVTLSFAVTGDRAGEPLFMAVANAQGLDASSLFVPFTSPYAHRLAEGPDALAREVCAIFRDGAGLTTAQYCLPVDVDRTGGVGGIARLEGQASHAGITVELIHPDDPGTAYADTTDATGAYQINDVPGGAGYMLRFFMAGFVEALVYDVTVLTGTIVDRGVVTLAVPRATLTGTVTFIDRGAGQHGGIVIADATEAHVAVTGPSGGFVLPGVPVQSGATYTLTAHALGYIDYVFPAASGLSAGEVRDVGSAVLQKQQGDYRICAAGAPTCLSGALAFTASRQVLLDVATTTATCWRASSDPSFASAEIPWQTFINDPALQDRTFTFAPAEPDGPQSIYVQLGNATDCAAGPVSQEGATLVGVVSLDTTPPQPAASGAVVLDAGAIYNNHPSGEVAVRLSASDAGSGLYSVRVARQAPVFTAIAPAPYFSVVTATLDTAVQGTQWIYVQLCDAVGNCTCDTATDPTCSSAPASPGDSIVYDRVPPGSATGAVVTIDGGAPVTRVLQVSLEVATGDAVAVRFGNTAELSGVAYLPVPAGATVPFPHSLTLGDGTKTVYVQYRDAAGNESPGGPGNPNFDSIDLDTTAPAATSLRILEGRAVRTPGFTAQLTATGAADYILAVATYEDYSNTTWQPFTGASPSYQMNVAAPFPIPLTDGDYTTFARFRDAAGNESPTLAVPIRRDSTPPLYAAITFVEGAFTRTQLANLALTAIGADSMIVAADGLVDAEPTEAYVPGKAVLLQPGTPGPHTVAVRFLDAAGNSTDASTTITWDDAPPTGASLAIDGGALSTRSPAVTLTLAGSDPGSGIAAMALANESLACSGASYEPFVPTRAWSLLPSDGTRRVVACLRDGAGNDTQVSGTITLDRDPPSGASIVIAGGGYTTVPALNVTLAAGGASEMCLAGDLASPPDCIVNGWGPYGPSASVTLSAGDGGKVVTATFRDAAGNLAQASDSIVLDSEAPTAPLLVLSPSPYVTGATVTATLGATGATQMCLWGDMAGGSTDACATAGWQSLLASLPITLSAGPGLKTINVLYRDGAQWLSVPVSAAVTADAVPPATGTVQIDGGALTTRTTAVTLTLAASDATSGIADVALANESITCASATYEPLVSTRAWTLSASDGLRAVAACFRDRAGNTLSASSTITLDRQAPTGVSVTLASGSPTTTTAAITVGLAYSGATEMCIAGDVVAPPDCITNGWEPVAIGDDVTLADGDGTKGVVVGFRDAAGNVAYASDTIILDTQAPYAPVLTLTPSPYTTVPGIAAGLGATGASEMCLWGGIVGGSSDSCALNGWEPLLASEPLTLAGLDGTKTVNVVYRDAAGLTSVAVSADVVLDATPPTAGTVTLTGLDRLGPSTSLTRTQTMSVALAGFTDATSGVTQMMVSESSGFPGGTWQTYSPSFAWTLSAGDGPKSLYVKVRDAAGTPGTFASGSITLDTLAPQAATVVIDGGNAFTNNPAPTDNAGLTLSASGATRMRISVDGVFDSEPTIAYGTSAPVTLTGEGLKTVWVIFLDDAGNASPAVTDTIVRDTTAPNGTVLVNGGAPYTNSLSVTLTLLASNANEMQIAVDGTCSDEPWVTYAATAVALLASGEGSKTVCARFRDLAQNPSAPNTASITLDTVAPTIPVITTARQRVNANNITLTIAAAVTETNFREYQVAGGPMSYPNFIAISGTRTQTTFNAINLDQDFENNLRLRAVDFAGNVSAESAVVITEDSLPPGPPVNLRVEEGSGTVRLLWSPSTANDVAGYRVHYGLYSSSNASDYRGQFATQGPSPVILPAQTTSLTLSGLVDFNSFWVAVSAFDSTQSPGPNESLLTPTGGIQVMPRQIAIAMTGSISVPGATSVVVEKGYAYVSGHNGFSIFDVSRPTTPTLLGSFASGDLPELRLYDGHAYLYNRSVPGLRVLDVRNPANIVAVDSGTDGGLFFGPNSSTYPNYKFQALKFAYDGYADWADAYALVRLDGDSVCQQYTDDGSNRAFRLVKFWTDWDPGPNNGAPTFSLDPNTDFTCAHRAGYFDDDRSEALEVTANRVYFADPAGWIWGYKRGNSATGAWTNPARPAPPQANQCRGTSPTVPSVAGRPIEGCMNCPDCQRAYSLQELNEGLGTQTHIVVSGDYMYASAGSNGFFILDLTQDPVPGGLGLTEQPALMVGKRDDGNVYGKLLVDGSYLYVADEQPATPNDVWVYDISDRAAPRLVGSYFRNPSGTLDFAIEGNFLYRVAANGTLEVARIAFGSAFEPVYTLGNTSFYEMVGGFGFGTQSHYAGDYTAYDTHSLQAPDFLGTTKFTNERWCTNCGFTTDPSGGGIPAGCPFAAPDDCGQGKLGSWRFQGMTRFDRFGIYWGQYTNNTVGGCAQYQEAYEYNRDPFLHFTSLAAVGSSVETGSTFDVPSVSLGQVPVGSTVAGEPAINFVNDVAVSGRWAYTTGRGLWTTGCSGDVYPGSLLAKTLVSGPEGPWGAAPVWVDPANRNGHRLAIWQDYAVVLSEDEPNHVYFFDTCANAWCDPRQLTLGGQPYFTSSTARVSVVAYGKYVFLGSEYGSFNTVQVLDMTPVRSGNLPTQAAVFTGPNGCVNMFVSGDLVYCADGGINLDIYDISNLSAGYLKWTFNLTNPKKPDVFGNTVRVAAGDYTLMHVR